MSNLQNFRTLSKEELKILWRSLLTDENYIYQSVPSDYLSRIIDMGHKYLYDQKNASYEMSFEVVFLCNNLTENSQVPFKAVLNMCILFGTKLDALSLDKFFIEI